MKELKKGDFSGIYTKEDNKPLFYTGIYDRMKDADGRPCVFLATDPENKNTFYRWTQSDLLKRGYYITKTGKNTIPRDAARLHIIFTHSGSLDGIRATVERDMFGEWTITTETGEKYAGIVGQLRNTAFCVILKTETAEEIEATRPQDGPTAPETETAGETTTGSETAPQEATSEATTTSFYYIVTNNNGETVAAGEVAAPIEEITATATREAAAAATRYTANTGLPARYTYGGSKTPIAAAALEYIKRTTAAQEAPTRPETVTDEETPTSGATARPKRRAAYMVECRSPRGSWKQYSGEKDTREEAEKIKEEAEAQRACTVNEDLILYRIVQIDKGPETSSQDAPTARQTAAKNASGETSNEATKASQGATPATAAAGSTLGGPTTAGTIAADTRTAGAAKAAPQGQERATAAGGIAARTKNANKAGHACEIAPGRTERAQAVPTTTPHHKRPHRGKTRADPARPAAKEGSKKLDFGIYEKFSQKYQVQKSSTLFNH